MRFQQTRHKIFKNTCAWGCSLQADNRLMEARWYHYAVLISRRGKCRSTTMANRLDNWRRYVVSEQWFNDDDDDDHDYETDFTLLETLYGKCIKHCMTLNYTTGLSFALR